MAAKLTSTVKYYETSKSTLTYAKRITQMALGVYEPSARFKYLEEHKFDQQLEEYTRLLHCALAVYLSDACCQLFLGSWHEAKISVLISQDIARQLHATQSEHVCHTCASRHLRAQFHTDDNKLKDLPVCALSEYAAYVSQRCDEILAKNAAAYAACQT
jgi:hypothetical protein